MDTTFHRNVFIEIRNKAEFEVLLADSGGDSEACKLRMNAFKENKPHGFMILFSIDNRDSFENVENWVREVRNINETVPIILVACKRDLRENAQINHDLISV